MSGDLVRVEEIPIGSPRLRQFVAFPWQLYRGDPCWTPPLNADYLGNRLLGLKGLLTSRHPYHAHAEVTHFLAWRGERMVGRVAATVNRQYNEYHHTSIGNFGLFETVDDYEVARMLLDCARQWVASRGMTLLRGPGEYSNATHERQGVLVDGFEHPPTVECTHNPPYYDGLLQRYGFRKTKDYIAFIADMKTVNVSVVRRLARKVASANMQTRPIVMSKLREELRLIVDIYNDAWSQNWGFLPISGAEADAMADSLRLIIDPDLVRLAYVGGKSAAVMGIIPDPDYALRPRWRWYGDSDLVRVLRLLFVRGRIPRTRGMFFGIRPEFRSMGIPALLASEIADQFFKKRYVDCEGSLVLEDNFALLKVASVFGTRHYKRWRIYDLPLV